MTDEDTGKTDAAAAKPAAKSTRSRKTTAKPRAPAKPKAPAKPRAKATTAKPSQAKTAAAEPPAVAPPAPATPAAATTAAATTAAAKPAEPVAPDVKAPESKAPEPVSPPASKPAPSPAPATSASTESAAVPKTPTTPAPPASTATGTTSTPPPPANGGEGLFSLPMLVSLAAVVIAILVPLVSSPKEPVPVVTLAEKAALQEQQAGLAASVEELKASIAALTQEQAAVTRSLTAVKVPAIMIAASDLRDEIEAGEPFDDGLNLFRAIVGADEAAVASVFMLESQAEAGVPTAEALRTAFGDVSHSVVAAYQTVDAQGGDLAQRVSETMANLTAATTRLRWRLDGAPEGDSPLAIMARAEQAATTFDFDTVIAELDALPDNLKALTAVWVGEVDTRKIADKAIEELDVFMIETIAKSR